MLLFCFYWQLLHQETFKRMEENILDDDIKQQITGTALMELKSSSIWILAVATMSILVGVLLFFACSAVLFGIISEDVIFWGFLLGTGLGGISLFYFAWVQFWYSKAVYQLRVLAQNDDIEEDASLGSIYIQMVKVWRWGAVVTVILAFLVLFFMFMAFYGAPSTEMVEPGIPASVQADTSLIVPWVAPAPNFDTIEGE